MDAEFRKQRFTIIYNLAGLLSGVVLVFLFGFFLFDGAYTDLDDILCSVFFTLFGALVAVLCGGSLFVNRKAFLRAEEQRITGLCQLGLSLNCTYPDVRSVSCNGVALSIQLKSGKTYTLMNLENGAALARYIQKRMCFDPEIPLNPSGLMSQISPLTKKRNREAMGLLVCFLLLILGILLTAALTCWKDLSAFSRTDWIVFGVMSALGILVIAVIVELTRRCAAHNNALFRLRSAMNQAVFRGSPLPPGNPVKVFLDDPITPSLRLTVFGYPNCQEVYFTVEQMNRDNLLSKIYESDIYPDLETASVEFEDLTEIPLPQ